MTRRTTQMLSLACSLLGSAGCATGAGEEAPLDEAEGCSDEDTWVADHCGETYCGAAEATVGTGEDGYVELAEGDDIDIMFGSQGGYHLDIGARTTRLCPIIYLRAQVEVDVGRGWEEIADADRHVEAVRVDPHVSSAQEFWGMRAIVPCEHWPDTGVACSGGAGSEGHLEDYPVRIRIEAEDHSGRVATDELIAQPVCCGG